MIAIAIFSEDLQACGAMETCLLVMQKQLSIRINIDVYTCGAELLKDMKTGAGHDILCLYLPENTKETVRVLKIAGEVRQIDRTVHIIFRSDSEKPMKKCIEVWPSAFLVGRQWKTELGRAMQRLFPIITEQDEYLRIRYKQSRYRIPVKEILYCCSSAKKTLVVTERNICQVYKKLDEVQKQLEQSNKIFIRCHKSYLVNLSHVRRVSARQILLNNGEILPVSSSRKKQMDEQLHKYMSWRRG